MKKILVSGSVAYDNIIEHHDLNVVDTLPDEFHLDIIKDFPNIKQHFGGTGGNIAYNMSLLNKEFGADIDFRLLTNVGHDFNEYESHLKDRSVDLSYLKKHSHLPTSRALVFGNKNDDQRSKFYLGATKMSLDLPDDFLTFDIYHLAPEFINNTAYLAKILQEQNKKYFFDPGQTVYEMVSKNASMNGILPIEKIIGGATGLFVNEVESEVLERFMKKPIDKMFSRNTEFIIRTMGSKGLDIFFNQGKECIHLDVFKPNRVVDPTGCGDSLRGGFLFQLANDADLISSIKVGGLMGSFAIEHDGGQSHNPSKDELLNRLGFKDKKLKI